ncbi:MAG: M48 family metalloprotease [Patescibacteria group bacterium]|jgi:heat shock protein HtpX
MYNQIDSNKRKTVLIMAIFFAVMIGIGYVFSYVYNNSFFMVIAVGIALVQAWVSYYHGDAVALAVSQAQPLKREQALPLFRIVENLTISGGLPMPKLYLIQDSAPNAFATGRDPKNASLAVTSGLLDKLDKQELEGVIAHELSHIGNRDILVMCVVMVLVGAIAMISDFFMRSLWFRGRDNREGGNILMIVGIALAIIAPIVATLMQLAVSRKREYLADASGALLTRYPEGLASALEKIAADKEPLEVANKATAMLYIENPLKDHAGALNNLFSTHPPVADRIKKLRQMA